MSYPIEVSICSHNGWFTPAEAKAYYDRYARDGVTIHWWGGGETADKHDGIVSYFMGQAQQGVKSVNYVVSDIKITKMVEPDNVAWASQSGNPTTVSIEFQPTLSDEGYKRGGWLIAQLEVKYGKTLSLYPHSKWFATSCPGTIDINRLRSEADKAKGDGQMAKMTKEDLAWLMPEMGVFTPMNDNDVEFHINQHGGNWDFTIKDLLQRKDRVKMTKELINACYMQFCGHAANDNDYEYHLARFKGNGAEFVADLLQRKDLIHPEKVNKDSVIKYITDNLK